MVSNFQSCASAGTSADLGKDYLGRPSLHLSFLQRAIGVPGKTALITAVILVIQSFRLERTRHILLTPKVIESYRLSRFAVYRGLRALEESGLIQVNRQRGRGPIVSFVSTEDFDG